MKAGVGYDSLSQAVLNSAAASDADLSLKDAVTKTLEFRQDIK